MREKSDDQLFRAYAEHGCELSFNEIVVRYTDLVYSAAVRQVDTPDLAKDVTQEVFADLARKAQSVSAKLGREFTLVGWLYRSTRFEALNLRREDYRRQLREKEAMQHIHHTEDDATDWQRIRPLLDDAMDQLSGLDRDALLMRYFRNQDLRTIGQTLGVSDDAAQKRVARALDKLRSGLSDRGITTTATALGVVLSASAVSAAPAGLAAAISAAIIGTITPAAATLAAAKTIFMTTVQKYAVGAAAALVLGGGIYQAIDAAHLRNEAEFIRNSQASLVHQVHSLEAERDEVLKKLSILTKDNDRLRTNTSELARLRGEVDRRTAIAKDIAQNRNTSSDPFVARALEWKARENKLRELIALTAGQNIPELKMLDEMAWLNTAMDADLDSPEGQRKTMSSLRRNAENQFVIKLQGALQKYASDNNGQFPNGIMQLAALLEPPADASMLQRYAIHPASEHPNVQVGGEKILTQASLVDPDFDQRWVIGPNGYGSSGAARDSNDESFKTLDPAVQAFKADHGGVAPAKAEDLKPYISTPQEIIAYEKILKLSPDGSTSSKTTLQANEEIKAP